MKTLAVEGIALLVLVAALPLISLGTSEGNPVLWGLGLVALVVGGLLPVLTRFVGRPDEPGRARDSGMEFDDRTS